MVISQILLQPILNMYNVPICQEKEGYREKFIEYEERGYFSLSYRKALAI